jgi:hypothetical protein
MPASLVAHCGIMAGSAFIRTMAVIISLKDGDWAEFPFRRWLPYSAMFRESERPEGQTDYNSIGAAEAAPMSP